MDALAYTAPSLVTVLVLSSYLLFLSIFYHAFQKIFSAGILGPLLLGAIYARPLANILPGDVQSAVLSIGYLGLLLLIVQGGSEARMDILGSPKNLAVAIVVGTTGIVMPIGISMALLPLGFGYGCIESFAVGAALASTSLGTTFAVLSSFNGSQARGEDDLGHDQDIASGIANTRIGTILVGAALLDDIVGLVIIGVIATLGQTSSTAGNTSTSIPPWSIARPIVSSFLLLVLSWLLTRFALRPAIRFIAIRTKGSLGQVLPLSFGRRLSSDLRAQRLLATTLLIACVLAYSVISEEIGSSLLIGAFCSGALMKYVFNTFTEALPPSEQGLHRSQSLRIWSPVYLLSDKTALGIVQDTILMPFFFSSIGSAIPVKSMFDGMTIWRGIIFAGLMAFAKVCAGVWIFVVDWIEQRLSDRTNKMALSKQGKRSTGPAELPTSVEQRSSSTREAVDEGATRSTVALATSASRSTHQRPVWPASLLLGLALMSRGEIGFLVVNIASQGGLLKEEAFNVATWAIVLNTLAGPMSIGILMRTQHGREIIQQGSHAGLSRWN